MADATDPTGIIIAITSAALAIAGALKLLARELARAIRAHGNQQEQQTAALEANTEALIAHAQVLKGGTMGAVKRTALLVFLLLALLAPAACGTVDPLIIRALDRNRQVWQEDRRQDLDPELVTSREREFEAQKRYALSNGGADAAATK